MLVGVKPREGVSSSGERGALVVRGVALPRRAGAAPQRAAARELRPARAGRF